MPNDKLIIEEINESKIVKALDTLKIPSIDDIITAKIVDINENGVIVDIGLKTEGLIPIKEFSRRSLPKNIEIGSEIPVIIKYLNQRSGYYITSYREAKQILIKQRLKEIHQKQEIINCDVISKVKGGYIADIGINAFLPANEVDYRLYSPKELIEQTLPVTIINIKDETVILSHKKAVEIMKKRKKEELMLVLKPGDELTGKVTTVTEFGAFVDLGGAEGLLHISEVAWYRIEDIHQYIKPGDIIRVKVLKIDKENEKISLTLKQLLPHPWENIDEKYKVGDIVEGKVTSIVNFGVFLQLEPGIDALLHISEISWTKQPNDLNSLFKVGEKIKVKITDINKAEQKISVSLKQLSPNPWEEFKSKYPPGSKVSGEITRIVPFGIFVKLENDLEGLIHITDISWLEKVKNLKDEFSEGEKIDAVVLEVIPEEEKISLSYKHLTEDPFKKYQVGSVVKAEVIKVTEFGAVVKLDENTNAFIPAQELSLEKGKHPFELVSIGDIVEAKVIISDSVKKKIQLSIKRLELEEHLKLKEVYSQKIEPKLKDILEEK